MHKKNNKIKIYLTFRVSILNICLKMQIQLKSALKLSKSARVNLCLTGKQSFSIFSGLNADVKPFESIPGPKRFPLVGNLFALKQYGK